MKNASETYFLDENVPSVSKSSPHSSSNGQTSCLMTTVYFRCNSENLFLILCLVLPSDEEFDLRPSFKIRNLGTSFRKAACHARSVTKMLMPDFFKARVGTQCFQAINPLRHGSCVDYNHHIIIIIITKFEEQPSSTD